MNKQWIMIHRDKPHTLLLIEEGIFFVFSNEKIAENFTSFYNFFNDYVMIVFERFLKFSERGV
ncbi:hypothetical protein FE205_02760 [Bacillus subtilis]|nr:hypothetical protein Y647_10850 [Bacillus subtilis QH-1]MBR0002385.1 hypothetical protein [Bacillus subtilis]MDR4253519.1 hypothetical protein [Bacillus subtilis subsp. subtilis NCIB 3610 = ATCC 6051 = DSM 10]MDR4280893.1 hypothetical protein [Bacillus subtilis KCTC 1028 = ATCC 6051a]QDW05605.1 hypothetical protein FFE90_010400 [Bacillus sp. KBS0812]